MSYDMVRRRKNKTDSGLESIENSSKSEGRSLHLVTILYQK